MNCVHLHPVSILPHLCPLLAPLLNIFAKFCSQPVFFLIFGNLLEEMSTTLDTSYYVKIMAWLGVGSGRIHQMLLKTRSCSFKCLHYRAAVFLRASGGICTETKMPGLSYACVLCLRSLEPSSQLGFRRLVLKSSPIDSRRRSRNLILSRLFDRSDFICICSIEVRTW